MKLLATKTNEISAADYKKILGRIQKHISQTEKNIFNSVTRKKVEMAWNIGQVIEKSLIKKDEKTYGAKLMEQLEQDVKISKTVLYKMRNFYKAYPKLPKDDPQLNWSHYRVLAGVKRAEERKYLEGLARENSWDSDELQKEVGGQKEVVKKAAVKVKSKKIQPTRGKVFIYKIIEIDESGKKMIDCGFKIFREIKEVMPKGAEVVFVSKKSEKYSLKKSDVRPQLVHTYKATVKRVVDGDTLRVNLDLGFGIFHEEIIRLAKVSSLELATDGGKNAKAELTKILQSVPFFILKSIKTDIFNRYVADIFLPQNPKETDLQKIADAGIYLNQLLLDKGLAVVF